jgi:hypothetical protein
MFIVDDAHGYSLPTEAANNAQSLVVAANHHRPDGLARPLHRCWTLERIGVKLSRVN